MTGLVRGLLLIAAVALLSSCQEDGTVATDPETGAPDLLADQREACQRSGGRWTLRGGDSLFVCIRETHDANKSCSTANDCDGMCLARSRTCSPFKPFLGCHETLTAGGLPATVCVN